MGEWFIIHWFDFIQTIGIVAGLIFTAHAIHRDERARQITNMIALNEQHSSIWQEFYRRPELSRVLKKDVDLKAQPVTNEEWLFVKMLMLHLDTVRRAMKAGVFVKIEGMKNDVRDFIDLPIPKAVWKKIKPFQDEDFIAFVEN